MPAASELSARPAHDPHKRLDSLSAMPLGSACAFCSACAPPVDCIDPKRRASAEWRAKCESGCCMRTAAPRAVSIVQDALRRRLRCQSKPRSRQLACCLRHCLVLPRKSPRVGRDALQSAEIRRMKDSSIVHRRCALPLAHRLRIVAGWFMVRGIALLRREIAAR